MTFLRLLPALLGLFIVHNAIAATIEFDPASCQKICTVNLIKPSNTAQENAAKENSTSSLKIRLEVPDEYLSTNNAPLKLYKTDFNFDGQDDLQLSNEENADSPDIYWVFNPSAKLFEYIGIHSHLNVDSLKKRLYTISKDNRGQSTVTTLYHFENGTFRPSQTEKSELTQQNGIYKKSHYVFENGKAKLLKVEFAYGVTGL